MLGSFVHSTTFVCAPDRYRQLDGLRCLAVLVVIWSHTEGADHIGNFGVGPYGVWLFFVLSGFLITYILLRLRDREIPLAGALRTFYARRILRIFPPYYALLAILLIVGYPMIRDGFAAHLLYLSNWYLIGQSPPYYLGHLWSLAVEEQFYLLWPLLVLLTPSRRLPWIFCALIVLAPFGRLALALWDINPLAVLAATTSNLDVLGAGALLAWHRHTRPTETAQRMRVLRCGLLLALALAFLTLALSLSGRGRVVLAVEEALSAALASAWLVERCVLGFTGVPKAILEWRPIVYVGTISYAVYLIQSPVHITVWSATRGEGIGQPGVPLFVTVCTVSVALASISWLMIERPVARAKRLFPYQRSAIVSPTMPAVADG